MMTALRPSIRLLRATLLAASCLFSMIPDALAQSPKTYNVREFGAVGDGAAKDTKAFQKALDACAVAGGGEVLVPAGKYLIGSVQMGNRTVLRLEAGSVIAGSPDPAEYPMVDIRWEGRWQPGRRALIYADNVEHIGIVGPGRIEGDRGVAAPQNPRGVVVLEPINCSDVHWEGFTVTQGGNWATHPTYCSDVVIRGVTINGMRDGIDVDSCKTVLIEKCEIATGDDCISLKSGRGLDGARIGKPTEDVVIKDCTLKGGVFACVGIGSETSGGVRNIKIQNCNLTARTDAIYIKTRIGRAGINENISGSDLTISGGGFLRINLTRGGNTNTADDPVEGLIGYPEARGLTFTGIKLNDAAAIATAVDVAPEKPIDGLSISSVSGTAKKGIAIIHARNVALSDINVTGVGGAMLATDDVEGTGLEGATKYVAPAAAAGRP